MSYHRSIYTHLDRLVQNGSACTNLVSLDTQERFRVSHLSRASEPRSFAMMSKGWRGFVESGQNKNILCRGGNESSSNCLGSSCFLVGGSKRAQVADAYLEYYGDREINCYNTDFQSSTSLKSIKLVSSKYSGGPIKSIVKLASTLEYL